MNMWVAILGAVAAACALMALLYHHNRKQASPSTEGKRLERLYERLRISMGFLGCRIDATGAIVAPFDIEGLVNPFQVDELLSYAVELLPHVLHARLSSVASSTVHEPIATGGHSGLSKKKKGRKPAHPPPPSPSTDEEEETLAKDGSDDDDGGERRKLPATEPESLPETKARRASTPPIDLKEFRKSGRSVM